MAIDATHIEVDALAAARSGRAPGTAATAAATAAAEPSALTVVPQAREAVLISLLRAHADLTRGLDQELSRAHGLTLSAYEILSRLSEARDGALRMSDLAAQTGLSVSRVSRLIDQLADRELVARRPCPEDSRAVHAKLEPAGRELIGHAQATFHAVVDARFLDRLSCDEVATLGGLLDRLHRRAPNGG